MNQIQQTTELKAHVLQRGNQKGIFIPLTGETPVQQPPNSPQQHYQQPQHIVGPTYDNGFKTALLGLNIFLVLFFFTTFFFRGVIATMVMDAYPVRPVQHTNWN